MNGLDLFSGIGGIGLALKPWVRTVAYCEQDPYAQGVLLSRMQSGDIDKAPIWDDVRTLQKGRHLPRIDIIFGGFPCQDISTAGSGKGLAGERSGLFFEIVRLARDCRPKIIFLENVPAISIRGLERVCLELIALGYDLRWTIVSAAEVGAPHQRDRWFLAAYAHNDRLGQQIQQIAESWIYHEADLGGYGSSRFMAYADSDGKQSSSENWNKPGNGIGDRGEAVADSNGRGRKFAGGGKPDEHQKKSSSISSSKIQNADGERLEEPRASNSGATSSATSADWWAVEPDVDRVVDGLPYRVDRIRCLGNSVVPLAANKAFKRLCGI